VNSAIQLYRSNRTEVLADKLAELLADPVGGPLDPEWIVVQGRGMSVWLAMELSRRHGVWAGGAFLYPRNFVGRAFEAVLGEDGARSGAYTRGRTQWAIMAVLEEQLQHEAFTRLRRYVERNDGGRRCYQLTTRIAHTFDQYLTYRPEMLLAWERGDDALAIKHGEAWQPHLWRALVARLGARHTASLERDFIEALSPSNASPSFRLPSRIAVFGLASMPPMYVRVLAALSQHIDVHWFMPSPARGYWSDVASSRRIERALERGGDPEQLHLDTGNPLLASFGRLGADMIDVMTNELDAMGVADVEPAGDLHESPDEATLLGRLQADVLEVRAGSADGVHDGSDTSILIHACHGPMREVEALHDQLLALLDGSDLAPHEIVVMTPDVESYAPLIEAVFERDRGTRRFIPYCIADRSARSDSPVIDAFLRMLSLVGSRARASELLDLLTLAPVQQRFDIDADEIDVVAGWVKETGIRWGLDAAHRAAQGQPPVHETTWRFGIERLLLGYAMPGEGRALYEARLPYDEVEGHTAQLAGKLAAYFEALFDLIEGLSEARSLEGWHEALSSLLDRMLTHDADNAWQHQLVRQTLTSFRDASDAAEYDSDVGVEVMRAALEAELGDAEPARGFLHGGVTFCAMVPMRSVPFRVVGMMGMSDGAFPRAQRPVDFDLMAKAGASRPGDRARRDDDRYLFLEALLSARDQVVITFVGQSIRDDSKLPPSVVVGDLIDYLVASHDSDPTSDENEESRVDRVHPQLLTRHPLQPFSPRYFNGSDAKLFSYVKAYRQGAAMLSATGRRSVTPLFDAPLAERDEDAPGTPVSLNDLARFFASPVRHLMNRRLGIDLHETSLEVSDREPVALDPLERYQLGDALLGLRVDGVDDSTTRRVARASGAVPPGTPGYCDHDDVMAVVAPIADRVRALRTGGRRPDLAIDMSLPDGTAIAGEIGERWAKGLLWHQFARISGKHLLGLWIRHLALCCAGEPLAPRRSFMVGRAPAGEGVSCLVYRRVEDPQALLASLVSLYRLGQREPLLLFPKSAAVYVQTLRGGKEHDAAIRRAATTWRDEEHARDPHLRRAFSGDTALLIDDDARPYPDAEGPSFAKLARAVFDPLLDHLDEVEP
jgi:exodeoxyribonuclease V gamma subunit